MDSPCHSSTWKAREATQLAATLRVLLETGFHALQCIIDQLDACGVEERLSRFALVSPRDLMVPTGFLGVMMGDVYRASSIVGASHQIVIGLCVPYVGA